MARKAGIPGRWKEYPRRLRNATIAHCLGRPKKMFHIGTDNDKSTEKYLDESPSFAPDSAQLRSSESPRVAAVHACDLFPPVDLRTVPSEMEQRAQQWSRR